MAGLTEMRVFELLEEVRDHRGSGCDGKDYAIYGAPEVGVVVDIVAASSGHIDSEAQKEDGVKDGRHFYKI